jgi:hypothetical protein
MLIDPREIEIISQARQKNIRDHTRSREHFNNIFKDFFCWIDFKSISVIDLGPGQYDFGLLAMERGAMQVAAIGRVSADHYSLRPESILFSLPV